MFDKHKASRQFERQIDAIIDKLRVPMRSFEDQKKWNEFYYTNPNWNTFTAFERRFNALAAVSPLVEELRPMLDEARETAISLAEFAASEKKRLADKRAKAAEPKPELESGVKLERADPEVVKTLLEGLADNRAAFIERHRANKAEQIEKTLARALDGTFAQNLNPHSTCRAQVFAEWGLYNSDATCEKLATKLSDQKVVDGYLAKAQKEAAFEFDSYVIKLAGKVTREGATKVMKATMSGNVWSGVLSVETDANHQTWDTKCIINTSPLGKLFHQWPTILKSLTAK